MEASSYDRIGRGYSGFRRTDPRISASIEEALGDAESVLNVGAGAGSYEPRDREVLAVEPSAEMIAQRPPNSAPVVQANAEALPFEDRSFDAAIRASISVFHRLGEAEVTQAMVALERDLGDRSWERRNAAVVDKAELDLGLRLVTAS